GTAHRGQCTEHSRTRRGRNPSGRVKVIVMKRWLRRTLRRYGVELTFRDVVCTEHVKSIGVASDGRTDVTIQRALVFLAPPQPGDLRDVISIDPEADLHGIRLVWPYCEELAR